ncbi:MAG: hypothetical protein WBJ34_09765 [Syntrophomonadaceae bacterium]
MTATLLDRLTYKAHILNINSESYSFKQVLDKQNYCSISAQAV